MWERGISGLGVGIAILHENQILLIQRADFEVWGLPGGEIDPGEIAAQAAVREALEETGYEVELTGLVGLYATPQFGLLGMNTHVAVFRARITGGSLVTATNETLDARFFDADDLPEMLMPHHRTRIADVFAGIGGSAVRTQQFDLDVPASITSRSQLYEAMSNLGSSKAQLFMEALQHLTETDEVDSKSSGGIA